MRQTITECIRDHLYEICGFGSIFRRVRSNGSVSDGNWHHIVGVRIAAAGANTLLLYVDRVLQIEKADANNINVNNPTP